MKKSAYFASALLLAATALSSCDKKVQGPGEIASANKTAIAATDSTGSHETVLANYIRYVDTQRILAEYTLAKEMASADSTAQYKLAALQNTLSQKLNNQAAQIQEKLQRNGYINEAAYNAEVASFQKAQQDAEKSITQRQYDYTNDMVAKQQQLQDSIQSVVNDYCRLHQLDAVLNSAAGLYFNPTLDITDIIIGELNRRYNQ